MGDDTNWDQAGQGALGGGMTGASIGTSILPGWGTVIGGGLGAIFGGLAGAQQADYQSMLKKMSNGFGSRQSPKAGYVNTTGYSPYRQNQQSLVAQLEAMARGEGPSAAAMQMRDAMDRAAGAQASAAAGAGGRGVNAGAALRQAANNTAQIQSQGARDTAIMRQNEQMASIGQLSQTLAQGRAADEGVGEFNAAQRNASALAQLQAKLQMLGLNDEGQLKALQMLLATAGPGMGASILAGGASALPAILQYKAAKNNGAGSDSGYTAFGSGSAGDEQFTANPVTVAPDNPYTTPDAITGA